MRGRFILEVWEPELGDLADLTAFIYSHWPNASITYEDGDVSISLQGATHVRVGF